MKINQMMKLSYKILPFFVFFIIAASINTQSVAQPPPPPPAGHGLANDNPPGGGAPIGDGMFLLLGLAGMYGAKKLFDLRRQVNREELT
jgi:hypothetical protein